MAKKLISLRISDLTDRQIAELTEHLGMTQTELVSIAIDRIHQQEKQTMSALYDIVTIDLAPGNDREYQTASMSLGDPVDLDEYIAQCEADGLAVYHLGVSPQIPEEVEDILGLIREEPDEVLAVVSNDGVQYIGANRVN